MRASDTLCNISIALVVATAAAAAAAIFVGTISILCQKQNIILLGLQWAVLTCQQYMCL